MRGVCLFIVSVLAVVSGCGPHWEYNYDAALRQARRSDRDVLVLYKDPLDANCGQVCDILESPEVASRFSDKVWCMLVPFYGPHRHFVAQYGVAEAPAIVVVHPDNTYHTLTGVHSAERVIAFLESATAPGLTPKLDPRVPRRVALDYFNIFERARDQAERQNRRLFIIYKWWLDPDSTELIQRIRRPHVARYFQETVNCILDWDHVANRRHVAQYGATGFPAMIMVEPTGRHRVLNGLHSDEEIIRFAVSRLYGGPPHPLPPGP
ncbi:MAG: hypothetical protein V3W34_08675 [Phycisphaerae bacterium]